MNRSVIHQWMYGLIILAMVIGFLPARLPEAQAAGSATPSPGPASWPTSRNELYQAGQPQLQVPLSPGARNGLLAAQSGRGNRPTVPDPTAGLPVVPATNLVSRPLPSNSMPADDFSRVSSPAAAERPSAGVHRVTASAGTGDSPFQVFLPEIFRNFEPLPEIGLVIQPETGGVLSAPGDRVKVTFAPGAVDRPALVSYSQLTPSQETGKYRAVEPKFVLRATFLDGTPVTLFRHPVQIEIRYQDGQVTQEHRLVVRQRFSSSTPWISVPTRLDIQNNIATVYVSHFSEFGLVEYTGEGTVIPLAPKIDGQCYPDPMPKETFYQTAVDVSYLGEFVCLSSTPDGTGYLVTDDFAELHIINPDGTDHGHWWDYRDFQHGGFKSMPPQDLTAEFQTGTNHVTLELEDVQIPCYGSDPYYLIVADSPIDLIPPVITDVSDWPDGEGGFVVEATVTDNVAVATIDLYYNGNIVPMVPIGGDRYRAVVRGVLHGTKVSYYIFATDTSGNVAYWPTNGNPEQFRIAYTNWMGKRKFDKPVLEPVSSGLGPFFYQNEDLTVPGRGLDFIFTRSYYSVFPYEGPLGLGWTHNYNMWLEEKDNPLLHGVLVHYPDGRTAKFTDTGHGFEPPPDLHDLLTRQGSGYKLLQPDQTAYYFNSEGRLARIQDRHSNTLTFEYTGGDLTRIVDTVGRTFTLEYEDGRIVRLTDPLGRTLRYSYDDQANLRTFTDARGGVWRYEYNDEHQMTRITDPEGITFLVNVYDDRGRVIEQYDAHNSRSTILYNGETERIITDNLGNRLTLIYDDQHRLVEERDALGKSIFYEYDEDYNLTARVDKMGRHWEYTYDDRGNLLTESGPLGWHLTYTYNDTNDRTSMTDALDRTTTYVWENGNLVRVERPDDTAFVYTYDGHGQRLTATDPNGHTTHFTYDEYGNLKEVRSPLGHITRYDYDGVGRMTSMTDSNNHTARFEYDGNDNITRLVDPRQHDTRFEYDGNDCLVKMVDRRGGVWTYEYDRNLKLTAETDPEGHRTTHTYDQMYNRTSTTDPRGHTTTFGYDELYRLVRVEDARGGVTRYEYDPNDNLTRVIDALEQTTRLEYDELNRLMKVTDALNGETEYHYDAVGRLVRLVNPRDAETHYAYDDVDRLIRVTDALNGETDYDYDDAGNLIAVTDANSHTIHFRYDADDRLIERRDPAGHVTAYQHDGVGNLVRLVDARNNPTAFEYDENDNLVRVTDALGGQTAYTYDEEDARISVTDPNNHTTRFGYNRDGLLVQLTEAGGQVSRFEYDAAHNLTRLVNAKGNATVFEYDELNRLIAGTDPLGNPTAYEYDELSRLIAVTDANQIVTRYEYDPLDRLTAVVQNYRPGQPADHQTNVRTAYTYDPVGNLLTITDANGQVTSFAYDLLDRLIREVNPIGNTWRYEYDPVGNLKRRVDANGAVTDYTYDADDLLVGIHYPDNSQVTFAYDETHNQVTMTDALGVTRNSYDPLNRLTSSTNHLGQRVGYAYDPAGNRIAITYPDGRVVRTEYDPTNYPSRVIDPDGNTFAADYDPTHNITRILYPNQTRARMTYDAADRLRSVVNEQVLNNGKIVPISTFAYTLDPVGNRTHSDEYYSWRQPETLSHDYTYDPLYRLTRSQDSEGRFTVYAYDAVGNRRQMNSNYDPLRTPTDVDPYTVDYTYNAANQLLTTDHSLFGVTNYTYDANGNRIRRQGPDVWIGNPNDQLRTDYTYDYENRLTWAGNFFDPGNGQWQVRDETAMLYDGYGRLFRRTHDQHQGGGGQKWTEFVYDGLDPIAEYVEPSPQYTNYYRGLGRILSLHDFKSQGSPPGTACYFHHDGLGSVSAITRHRGQSAHTYRYWDYGMVLDKNDRAADSSNFTDPHNHYTFTGQEWEEYTWLYHFYAREYDPVVGVWLQQDPYRGHLPEPMTLHRYGYTENNPICFVDYRGYWLETALDVVSLKLSCDDFRNDPSLGNAAWVALDTAALVLPCIPATGTAIRGAKAVLTADKMSWLGRKIHEPLARIITATAKTGVKLPSSLGKFIPDGIRGFEKIMEAKFGASTLYKSGAGRNVFASLEYAAKREMEWVLVKAPWAKIPSSLQKQINLYKMAKIIDPYAWAGKALGWAAKALNWYRRLRHLDSVLPDLSSITGLGLYRDMYRSYQDLPYHSGPSGRKR